MSQPRKVGKRTVEVDEFELDAVEWIRQEENQEYYYSGLSNDYDYREPDWSERCIFGKGDPYAHGKELEILTSENGKCRIESGDMRIHGGLVMFNKPKTVRYHVEIVRGTDVNVWIEM